MKWNVLVIVVDALRSDRVGAFEGRKLTPNIDELSTDSAVFTNAYSTTNATDPAITSLQTGRYPISQGVINHGTHVTTQEKNTVEKITQLPEVLLNSGYRTAKFGRPLGRWHRNGFERYPSSMESRTAFDERNNTSIRIKQWIGDSLERIHPKLRTIASNTYQYGTSIIEIPHRKEKLIREYQENLDEVVQNFEEFVQGSTPFYSFIHLMDTHTPYAAGPELVASYLNKFHYKTDLPMRRTGNHPHSFDKLIKSGEYPDIKDKYYLSGINPTTALSS